MGSVLFWVSTLPKIPKHLRSEVYLFAFLYLNSNYSYIMLSNGIVISKEFQRLWKEAVETYFKTLF